MFDTKPAQPFNPISESGSNNLVVGVLGGAIAALVGAAAWAAITVATGWQIGFMAIGVGFLVGMAVRKLGRGSSPPYAIAGAALALGGCLAGNALALVGFHANAMNVSFLSVLTSVEPVALGAAMVETASAMDFVFYAIAVYEGFRLARVPAEVAPAAPAA